jgi:nitroreductase
MHLVSSGVAYIAGHRYTGCMDIYELIRTRKSVRSYLPKEVEQDKLERVLEAARLAPSAKNRQEWRFVVVTDQKIRDAIVEKACPRNAFISEAPVLLVCCAETDGYRMTCGQPTAPIDVSIAIDHITLAATAEGLGTCWVGAFATEPVHDLIGIPKAIEIIELLPLGYPKDPSPVQKKRLSLPDIVRYEKW